MGNIFRGKIKSSNKKEATKTYKKPLIPMMPTSFGVSNLSK